MIKAEDLKVGVVVILTKNMINDAIDLIPQFGDIFEVGQEFEVVEVYTPSEVGLPFVTLKVMVDGEWVKNTGNDTGLFGDFVEDFVELIEIKEGV